MVGAVLLVVFHHHSTGMYIDKKGVYKIRRDTSGVRVIGKTSVCRPRPCACFRAIFPFHTAHSCRELAAIAKRLLNVVISFLTARAIGILPPLIDHNVFVLSGGWLSFLQRTRYFATYTSIFLTTQPLLTGYLVDNNGTRIITLMKISRRKMRNLCREVVLANRRVCGVRLFAWCQPVPDFDHKTNRCTFFGLFS